MNLQMLRMLRTIFAGAMGAGAGASFGEPFGRGIAGICAGMGALIGVWYAERTS